MSSMNAPCWPSAGGAAAAGAAAKGSAPKGSAAGGGPAWRVSVYEIELYPSDADTAGLVSGFPVPRAPFADQADYAHDTGASGRVVCVMHLPVPA